VRQDNLAALAKSAEMWT